MGRNALLIGGVVVAGAIVALVLTLKKDTRRVHRGRASEPVTSPVTTSGTTSGTSATSEPGGATTAPAGSGSLQPGAPGGPPPVAASTDPRAPVVTPSNEPRGNRDDVGSGSAYTVGNLGIRDHRGSNAVPVDVPPNVHAPGEKLIDSTLTNAIGRQVRTTIYACAKEAGREGRGKDPRIEGQFAIDVQANVLKVVSAMFQVRDLADAQAAAIKQCVESKVVGMTTPAPNQADIASYGINVTLRLP